MNWKSRFNASGINPDTNLVEIIEIKDHPFFIGVQYHPEYKSTVAKSTSFICEFCKSSS